MKALARRVKRLEQLRCESGERITAVAFGLPNGASDLASYTDKDQRAHWREVSDSLALLTSAKGPVKAYGGFDPREI
jgi:hypothetical protein